MDVCRPSQRNIFPRPDPPGGTNSSRDQMQRFPVGQSWEGFLCPAGEPSERVFDERTSRSETASFFSNH
jgi:hypothetical protein